MNIDRKCVLLKGTKHLLMLTKYNEDIFRICCLFFLCFLMLRSRCALILMNKFHFYIFFSLSTLFFLCCIDKEKKLVLCIFCHVYFTIMESLSPYDNHFIDDKVPAFYLLSCCYAAPEK